MDRICQAKLCKRFSKYSCSCDQDIRSCSDHLLKHNELPWAHTKIKISFKKLVRSIKEGLNNLKVKRKLCLDQGMLAINKIFEILREFEQQINLKNKELITLLKSSIYCTESEEKIERITKVTFNNQIMMDIKNQINILFDISLLDLSKYNPSSKGAIEHEKSLTKDYISQRIIYEEEKLYLTKDHIDPYWIDDYINMPDQWVKYRKEQFRMPGLEEFQYIARFSNTESSLYQALSVGFIETLLRFQLSNNPVQVMKKKYDNQQMKALAFACDHQLEEYVVAFINIIANITEKSPDRMTGFQWLAYYSETAESAANSILDYGMRVLICSILIGKAPTHQRIFSDQITDEDVFNIFYAISSMGMQITVYNGQDKANHVKATPGEYPVIILYQNGRNFSLLYTAKMIEIETNPNFSKNDVENPPFMVNTANNREKSGNQPGSNLSNQSNPNLIPQSVRRKSWSLLLIQKELCQILEQWMQDLRILHHLMLGFPIPKLRSQHLIKALQNIHFPLEVQILLQICQILEQWMQDLRILYHLMLGFPIPKLRSQHLIKALQNIHFPLEVQILPQICLTHLIKDPRI